MHDPVGTPSPFSFDYKPGRIEFGAGATGKLAGVLEHIGATHAVVVTGRTVGETPAVMDPVRDGLGDRLARVVAETTPEKRLSTAGTVAEAVAATGADALVAVGGGSSLDVAKAASIVAATDRSLDTLARELADTGTLALPSAPLPKIVAVPTTLAGADLSQGAGIGAGPESGLDREVSGGVSHERLFPAAVVADPELVATTPADILAASAMNGFDKGIETLYGPEPTPITDATATRGLRYLTASLPSLRGAADVPIYARALAGALLVQYGVSRPDASGLSLIHAFGHGLSGPGGMHQGRAHAVIAPHVLRYVFDHADGRRASLASALDVRPDERSPAALADGVVEAVAAVRDGLELPTRLSTGSDIDRDDLPEIAAAVAADRLTDNAPPGVDPTDSDLLEILEAAW